MDRFWYLKRIFINKKMKFISIKSIEQKIFGKKSRFELKKKQINELKKSFTKSRILIFGAAGSIGKAFSIKLNNYKIAKIIFLDKDENSLTELNREINLKYKKKITRDFICQDINDINIFNILKSEKITHFFNFAALKHVRSEENIYSLDYLIKTNCISPFKLGNLKKLKNLKKIFFISTDKAVYPSSLMGCSKKIMENELYRIKRKNKNKFVSTVRFANVAFSNGSLLKNIYNKTLANLPFGVPDLIKRYFVTHSEAADLCFISLLNESDNSIVIPSYRTIGRQILLKELAIKIVKLINKKPVFLKKIKNVKNNVQQIILEKSEIKGQKNKEFFHEVGEKVRSFNGDNRLNRINLYQNSKSKHYQLFFKKIRSHNDYLNFFRKIFNNRYLSLKSRKKVFLKNII